MTTLRKSPCFGRQMVLLVSSLLLFTLISCTSATRPEDSAAQAEDSNASDLGQDELAISDDLATEELGEQAKTTSADLTLDSPPAAAPAPAPAPEPQIAPEQKAENNKNFSGNFAEVSVTDIRYNSRKGGGTVVVETSAPATYYTREVPSQSQVVIEIANAQLPERLKRPYVTKDFNQSISSVNAYQDKGSSTVRIVVQFRMPMQADVRRDGRELLLTAAETSADIDDNPTLGVADNDPDPVPARPAMNKSRLRDDDPRILPSSSVSDRADEDPTRFYGKPISIEVRDTSVRDVLNLIAEQSGANIVLSSEVDGNISLKLRQVPWDEALLIVMKTRNLGYVRQGSILRIAPIDSLQKEADSLRRVTDSRKAAEPLRVKVVPVGYAKVESLEKQVLPFLTLGRGKVVADVRTNALILTDTPDVLDRVASLIRALDLPPLQVLIEGKVIEARETFSRDFGINWNSAGGQVELGGGRQYTQGFGVALPTQRTGGLFNFRITQLDMFGDISAALSLAEQQDQVKVVSSPRVVAVNNEKATIVQGTNIPVQTSTVVDGRPTITTTFQPIEMKLDVIPQVTSENDVIMQLEIKREFPTDRQAGQAPNINRREAKTKVLVRNGQTAVVGGVYQSDQGENESGVPWLKNVPVLGWLFKNKRITNEKSELLVFLTPRILNAETSLQKESTL